MSRYAVDTKAMSMSISASRPSHEFRQRSLRPRVAASVLALAAVLAASGAQAVLTLNWTSDVAGSASKQVNLNQDYWVGWSTGCANAADTVCAVGDQPNPNPTAAWNPDVDPTPSNALLFSWGEKGQTNDGENLNSVLRVKYTGADFMLDKINFRSLDEPLGPDVTGVPSGLNWPANQGRGTMVAYERSNSLALVADAPGLAYPHYVTDQRMDIRVLDENDNPLHTVTNWLVASPQSQAGDRTTDTDFFAGDDPFADSFGPNEGFPDYRFDQTYFFTSDSNAASTEDLLQSVEIKSNYSLEFQFYEAADHYDQASAMGTEPGQLPPDAYYGSFELSLTPADTGAAALTVEPDVPGTDLPLGTLRAGSESGGSLTATNTGDAGSTLTDVTFGPLTGTNFGRLEITDTLNGTPVNLGDGVDIDQGAVGAEREYAAKGLGLDDITPIDVDAEQEVTATNGTGSPQDRTITAQIVGPVLGVNDGAERLPYGSDINMGEVDVGGAVVKELVVSNLFLVNFDTDTSLTIFNVGIDGDTLGYYCILTDENGSCVGSGGATPLDGSIVLANGRALTSDGTQANATGDDLPSLWIKFEPGSLLPSGYAPTLWFETDMNSLGGYGVASTEYITFNLVAAAPVPGTVLLLGAGLFGLARYRGRRRQAEPTLH
jgi:hypothetical protein